MDVGTAKPDRPTRERVPHHLLDIVDPTEPYSAARFAADANAAIGAVRARGRVPIVAGGTMLYFKALTEGLSDLPGADPSIRAEIDRDAATRGWPRCTRSSAGSIRRRRPASRPATRSASSARSRSTARPECRCPRNRVGASRCRSPMRCRSR